MVNVIPVFKKNILSGISYLYLKSKGVEVNFGDVLVFGLPIIHKHPGSTIRIGKGVSLISSSKYNFAGINHPVILATITADAKIEIGDNSGVSGAAIVCATNVKIGEHTLIGANANIYDTDFHSCDPSKRFAQLDISEVPTKRIILGDNVWVGANCTILKGVEIGNESVVGAGSIVTKNIPNRELWVGTPAKFNKRLVF